jgi:hypothetical protein
MTPKLKAWIKTLPKKVQKVANKYPGDTCYRKDGGHYRIRSYDEEKDGSVSLQLIHGRDSFLPGVIVFGINPSDLLIQCNCGKWEPPTEEQTTVTRAMLENERENRK